MLEAVQNDTGKMTCETCPVAVLYLYDYDVLFFPSIWMLMGRKEGENEFRMRENMQH